MVQRGGGGGDLGYADAGIASRGVDAAMSEEHLNDPDVFAVLQQMRGKAMAEGMGGDSFVDPRQMSCCAADLLNGRRREVAVRLDGGK